ncbi:MAG: metal-dependent transcriptional regulator [Thermoanaerobaculales bacterium]|jgi:DtxR family Mn-dependent transcriptional regulator|nr:metal-dependent transcriptional regulator [Thermoanaerobaculales bacterium]
MSSSDGLLTASPSRRSALSPSQEDYLKQIYLLGEDGRAVPTQVLADRLEVRPASVTGMVQRLAEQRLVRYEPYRGVRLTGDGRRAALEVLRHHRLLETFLARVLGYGWDEVHDEAERLEHVISDRFVARMAEAMGHPTHDPHGDPIPDADLRMPREEPLFDLASLPAGSRAVVIRVGCQDPECLSALGDLGLIPGAAIEVVETGGDRIRVEVCDEEHRIPSELARELWLRKE